jgi:hypothetical protein
LNDCIEEILAKALTESEKQHQEYRMVRKTLVLISALALCALCVTQAFGKDITIRGKLRKTVEHGGWLIVVEKQKYLILNSQEFAGEKWFAEGNEVEATGEVKTGVMTIYMEGTPFQVRSMRPFEQSGPDTDGVTSHGLTRLATRCP